VLIQIERGIKYPTKPITVSLRALIDVPLNTLQSKLIIFFETFPHFIRMKRPFVSKNAHSFSVYFIHIQMRVFLIVASERSTCCTTHRRAVESLVLNDKQAIFYLPQNEILKYLYSHSEQKHLGCLPFTRQNRKFWLEKQMVCVIPIGKFPKTRSSD